MSWVPVRKGLVPDRSQDRSSRDRSWDQFRDRSQDRFWLTASNLKQQNQGPRTMSWDRSPVPGPVLESTFCGFGRAPQGLSLIPITSSCIPRRSPLQEAGTGSRGSADLVYGIPPIVATKLGNREPPPHSNHSACDGLFSTSRQRRIAKLTAGLRATGATGPTAARPARGFGSTGRRDAASLGRGVFDWLGRCKKECKPIPKRVPSQRTTPSHISSNPVF